MSSTSCKLPKVDSELAKGSQMPDLAWLSSRRVLRFLAALSLGASLLLMGGGCGDEGGGGAGGSMDGGGGVGGEGGDGGEAGGGGGGDTFPEEAPTVLSFKTGLEARELAILVNDQDPQSVAVAAYYQERRGIPAENVIHLSFPTTGQQNIGREAFAEHFAEALANTPATIQAYAVSWTHPSRVDCMSLTTAVAFGAFDTDFCNTSDQTCAPTKASLYYGSSSVAPYDDWKIRPTMMLAGESLDEVKALIDRGIASDDTRPTGEGWMVSTSDGARNVRFSAPMQEGGAQHEILESALGHDDGLRFTFVDNASGEGSNAIEGEEDVLFYFTGLTTVPSIETNTYLPGAVADHLTSFGGSIPAGSQMSVIEWLQAGVTASYGTLREPCNYRTKFPFIPLMVANYFQGATVVEAYWKSVAWPGEGLFVGEPLARPWGNPKIVYDEGRLTIETTSLTPGQVYQLDAGDSAEGPWTTVLGTIRVERYGRHTLQVERAVAPFYRLVPRQ